MSNFKNFEDLLNYWKAKEDKANESGDTEESKKCWWVIHGLHLARGFVNRPSNTQMQINKKTCHMNHYGLKEAGDNFCKNCGMSFYD